MQRITISLLATLFLSACTKGPNPPNDLQTSQKTSTELHLVIIGDSLTEGYGVAKENSYPALAEAKLNSRGLSVKISNSGISGSTSASAPERVRWALKTNPDVIALALGANDGLRGLPTSSMKKNLNEAIKLIKEADKRALLFGMLMPPNMGKNYTLKYQKVFKDLSDKQDVPLLPFLLKDVGGNPALNQADGVHPNEKGHEVIAETVYQFLKENLK